MRFPSLLLSLLALLLLTGCNTYERRAKQKADIFATLSPETRTRLENKSIIVGDTFDMVYIAVGNPDEKLQSTTATGSTTTWIYNRYWQEYQGDAYDGFRRVVVTDPKTGAATVYLEPVSRPIYTDRKQPILRITFTDGKVTVIEQPKT
jgi:hypothetical protein